MNCDHVFLSAALEGADAHNFDNAFSILKTSYMCPHCKHTNLIAEVYEQTNRRLLKEVDASCITCNKKISLSYE